LLTPEWLATVGPEVLYTLGQAYQQLQQSAAALPVFTALYERFPNASLTMAALPAFAVGLEQAGQRLAALPIWQAYLAGSSDLPADERLRLQLHAGRLAVQEGQLAVALALLAPVRGTTSPPLAAEALFWSGEAYFLQQQWEEALQAYQDVLDTQQAEKQWSTLAHLRMGTIYEHQHEWDRALQTYQHLLTTATDGEVLSTVQQRIAAIEAGRTFKPPAPGALPWEG
jgi:tetratricopeptide (TPR) repeat protein